MFFICLNFAQKVTFRISFFFFFLMLNRPDSSLRLNNFLFAVTFLSAITIFAEVPERPIFFIDFVHTFLCWSSLSQTIKFIFVFDRMSFIEYILGDSAFFSLIIYGFLLHVPLFLYVLIKEGISYHFPLFLSIPCSVFAYDSLNFPVINRITKADKIMYLLSMILTISDSCVPYTYIALIFSYIALHLFKHDVLGITKKLSDIIDGEPEISTNYEEYQNGIIPDTNINMDSVDEIINMGFSESDARNALQITHGDVKEAVDFLLDVT